MVSICLSDNTWNKSSISSEKRAEREINSFSIPFTSVSRVPRNLNWYPDICSSLFSTELFLTTGFLQQYLPNMKTTTSWIPGLPMQSSIDPTTLCTCLWRRSKKEWPKTIQEFWLQSPKDWRWQSVNVNINSRIADGIVLQLTFPEEGLSLVKLFKKVSVVNNLFQNNRLVVWRVRERQEETYHAS